MSTTYVSTIVAFLTLGLPVFGLEVFDENALGEVLTGIVGIGSLLYILYGRYRAGGISAFGLRKR